MIDLLSRNLLSWAAQIVLLAGVGAILPLLLRVRHPKTQLAYCHLLLVVCLLLPLVEPRLHPVVETRVVEARDVETRAPEVSVPEPARSQIAVPRVPPSQTKMTPKPLAAPPDEHTSEPWWSTWTSARTLIYVLVIGALLRLSWLLGGLWRIRRFRIGATPLYPIPESIRAASSITHADAVFCISSQVSGPVMLGWLAPVVLLPESFLELNDEAQCAIACHELLHVQRADWMVTLLEEFVGAMLWFNPGVWMLLAQARLAREELVDAETVRLTSAPEPYIDALLTIARGHQMLDLAPAPLFLRRRHLTQRMHALLNEGSISLRKLILCYGSLSAMVGFAGWAVCIFFPLVGEPRLKAAPAETQQTIAQVTPELSAGPRAMPGPIVIPHSAPVLGLNPANPSINAGTLREMPIPFDPQEPVVGSIQDASEPSARAAALYLIERARANGLTHRAGTPPYQLDVNFTSPSGSGRATETWLNGQQWQWTGALGSYSAFRLPGRYGEPLGPVPTSIHLVRNAVFWAIFNLPASAQVRTAPIQWNAKPATCVLISGIASPPDQGRLWEEQEYCVDNSTGAIQMHSVAPGVYTVYGYSRGLQFHGRLTPDRITIYTNGVKTIEADVNLTDLGPVNPRELMATPEMIARGPATGVDGPGRFAFSVYSPLVSGAIKPVVIHASLDGEGKVIEEELSATSDPALSQSALDVIKPMMFGGGGNQRQMYLTVKFTPVQ